MNDKLEKCVLSLYEIGVLKFGDFTLKSGMKSPVYFDLRIIISYPELMETVTELLWSVVPDKEAYKRLCGVAYTGIPLATAISLSTRKPMLLKRKEAKGHGTKKLVEGIFDKDDNVLIVEDVLVSGASVYETVESLRELDLKVENAVVFLDREQGGVTNLKEEGITITPVITLSKVMKILSKEGKCGAAVVEEVKKFIEANNRTSLSSLKPVNGSKV